MAGQGPKARALAKEITDGLISLGSPAEGFETCLVSTNGTVLDDGEDVTSPRASTAVKPLVALAYHFRYTTDPESVLRALSLCTCCRQYPGAAAGTDESAANLTRSIGGPRHVPTLHKVQSPCAGWPACRNVVAPSDGRRG